jgi:hypothetical protein
MFDHNDVMQYWLFFCTQDLKGLEVMKRAMWKVDSNGTFRFSDKHDPKQVTFLSAYDDAGLADMLEARFKGQTVTMEQIREYVLVETPYYVFKTGLGIIEKDRKRLTVAGAAATRRRGQYPDEQWGTMRLTFS